MKQICSYCGQDTYQVDIEYLVGHNHLSCMLIEEQSAEKMQIVNWKKLNGQRFDILGATFYISNCSENIKGYKCEIFDVRSNDKIFDLSLKKIKGKFDLEIVMTELGISSKIKRIVNPIELKSSDTFLVLIVNELLKNDIHHSFISLLSLLQKNNKNNKLKPVSGNVNFNMPLSISGSF